MTAARPLEAVSNPFSTRCIRPGAMPYLFPPGETLERILARLAAHAWKGQIIGPHGSGKSTLLAMLRRQIEKLGKRFILIELHDGQRRLPADAVLPWESNQGMCSSTSRRESPNAVSRREPAAVIVVDGYEQLPWWRQSLLRWRCARHGVGLLVTAHRSAGLPTLFQTTTDNAVSRQVVARLLDGRADLFTDQEIDRCLDRHGSNVREALFELYDLFESRRS